jgi:hypothetical protein
MPDNVHLVIGMSADLFLSELIRDIRYLQAVADKIM